MRLDEAIKIFQYQGAPENGPTILAFVVARKLLIEAGKRIQHCRIFRNTSVDELLPGETED